MSKIREMLLEDDRSSEDLLPAGMLHHMRSQIPAAAWGYLVTISGDDIHFSSGVLTLLPDSELEKMYARWLLEKETT